MADLLTGTNRRVDLDAIDVSVADRVTSPTRPSTNGCWTPRALPRASRTSRIGCGSMPPETHPCGWPAPRQWVPRACTWHPEQMVPGRPKGLWRRTSTFEISTVGPPTWRSCSYTALSVHPGIVPSGTAWPLGPARSRCVPVTWCAIVGRRGRGPACGSPVDSGLSRSSWSCGAGRASYDHDARRESP